ncbi:MAG: YukJ family protein [Bacillota bacterium]|nr:YukJ family protein [Bacillota bacterium]
MDDYNYGVLKCRIVETTKIKGQTPHFHIHTIADGVHFRISINIKSQLSPFDVLYYIDYNFENILTIKLSQLPFGFNPIGGNIKTELGLDYIRGNLFDLKKLQPLPDEFPGPDNDLNEKIREITHKALENQESILYVFGKRWGPEGKKDEYFHFAPSDGIHDIHMNQGNSEFYMKNNHRWQDGGLFIHYLPENHWNALFFAFQSQSFQLENNHKI